MIWRSRRVRAFGFGFLFIVFPASFLPKCYFYSMYATNLAPFKIASSVFFRGRKLLRREGHLDPKAAATHPDFEMDCWRPNQYGVFLVHSLEE
jgi:hypothetical protein